MTEVTSVLLEAFERGGFTTRSDFSRSHADYVAVAACEGLISTMDACGLYGRTWRLTPQGLSQLYKDCRLTATNSDKKLPSRNPTPVPNSPAYSKA